MTVEESNQARSQIKQSATHLFATRGFERCSVERLAEGAGVTTEEFFRHFDSPLTLFREIHEEISKGGLRALITGLMVTGSPSERIDSSARAVVDYFFKDPNRTRIYCIEGLNISQSFSEERRRLQNEYADVLVSGTRLTVDVTLSDIQLTIGTRSVVTALDSLLRAHIDDPENVRREDVAIVLSHICRTTAGLGPDT